MDDTVFIENLILINSTAKAYLVRDEDGDDVWIPRSQVIGITFGKDIIVNGMPAKEILELELPQWLAEDKNLY